MDCSNIGESLLLRSLSSWNVLHFALRLMDKVMWMSIPSANAVTRMLELWSEAVNFDNLVKTRYNLVVKFCQCLKYFCGIYAPREINSYSATKLGEGAFTECLFELEY